MKTIKLTSHSPEVFDDPKYCQDKNIGVSCDAMAKITAYMEDDIYVCLNFHAYREHEELYRNHSHGNGNLEKCNQCKDHYLRSKGAMKWISVNDRLPKENTYVLAHYAGGNWGDNDHQFGCECKVVKFIKGLSKEDRAHLPKNNPRKYTFMRGDEEGNNKKPYVWEEFGPGCLFGQDVDYWAEIPTI